MFKAIVSATLAVGIASPALAWHVGTPQSAQGLARNIPFEGALVWDLGYAAQLVAGCFPGGDYKVLIAFPRLEPFYLPPVQKGNITVWDGDAELWSSDTDAVTSFTVDEVVLPAVRSAGISQLLRAMQSPKAELSVSFSGIFAWDVHARPARSDRDAENLSRLGELCKDPSLSASASLEEDAIDSGGRHSSLSMTRWYAQVSERALAERMMIHRVSRTEVAITSDELTGEQLLGWGDRLVTELGGAVLDRNSTLNGASLRVTFP